MVSDSSLLVHTYYHFLAIVGEILIFNNVVIIQWRKIVSAAVKKGDFALCKKYLQKNYCLTLC